MAILTDLHDPRIEDVTVTYVEVTPDMRGAKVHVSVMGSESKQKTCLKGLESSAGYLQSKIAQRIDTRYTPRLKFELDQGVKQSIAISKMLREMLPEDETPTGDEATDAQLTDELATDDTSDIENPPPEADN